MRDGSSSSLRIPTSPSLLPTRMLPSPSISIFPERVLTSFAPPFRSTYDMMFQRMGINAAQVLITQGDFLSRER